MACLVLAALFVGDVHAQEADDYPFRRTDLPLNVRINDLISRLTLDEKVRLMRYEAPAIERLGIPAYNWWNEALHGVARTEERVTVFPQAIGLAATFDSAGVQRVGDIAATEGRALFNEDLKNGTTGRRYRGLTYWTPNVNIFRDPRWGRGQETYGEDPFSPAGSELPWCAACRATTPCITSQWAAPSTLPYIAGRRATAMSLT